MRSRGEAESFFCDRTNGMYGIDSRAPHRRRSRIEISHRAILFRPVSQFAILSIPLILSHNSRSSMLGNFSRGAVDARLPFELAAPPCCWRRLPPPSS